MARKLLVKWLRLEINAMMRTSGGTLAKEDSAVRVTDNEVPSGVEMFLGL